MNRWAHMGYFVIPPNQTEREREREREREKELELEKSILQGLWFRFSRMCLTTGPCEATDE